MLLLGAGGLGAPTALYLAAAGIGTIGIVDDDVVDESNLQRQVIHTTERVGEPKTALGEGRDRGAQPRRRGGRAQHSASTPPTSSSSSSPTTSSSTAPTTSPPATCSTTPRCGSRKPVVSASILGFEGQISTFVPYEGPCYRCLYPTPPPPELAPSCGANGVLGVMAGLMGLLQANEVIKLAAGIGEPLIGRLLLYESLGTALHRAQGPARPRVPDLRRGRAEQIPAEEMGKFPDYELFCGAPAREPSPAPP